MANQLVLSPIPLEDLISQIQSVIKSEISSKQEKDLQDKLLSPAETCKLFSPAISKVTLGTWTKEGRILSHRLGGRIFYKYSEVMDSLSTLQKFRGRQWNANHSNQ